MLVSKEQIQALALRLQSPEVQPLLAKLVEQLEPFSFSYDAVDADTFTAAPPLDPFRSTLLTMAKSRFMRQGDLETELPGMLVDLYSGVSGFDEIAASPEATALLDTVMNVSLPPLDPFVYQRILNISSPAVREVMLPG